MFISFSPSKRPRYKKKKTWPHFGEAIFCQVMKERDKFEWKVVTAHLLLPKVLIPPLQHIQKRGAGGMV
jgi:hypothetical protein